MNANGSMRMPLLDVAFHLMDSARSPQDFTLILHLLDSPDVDHFYAGAKSAMNRFPTSASCIDGHTWAWRENKYFKLQIVSTVSDSESRAAIEKFIDEPFDLRHQPPVRQMLILNGPTGASLVTRFHHAAADGLSAALWLGHQLNVAYGLEEVERDLRPRPAEAQEGCRSVRGSDHQSVVQEVRTVRVGPTEGAIRSARDHTGSPFDAVPADCILYAADRKDVNGQKRFT